MNNDVFVRDDLMTERVEVVKGGTGGILYSNGLGATVNHITRTGGDRPRRRLQARSRGLRLHPQRRLRVRADQQEPDLCGRWLLPYLKGLRDTGYTADRGGQVRGNLVYKSDDGRPIGLFATLLDDRTAVYKNLPIEVPGFSTPGTASNPIYINQNP